MNLYAKSILLFTAFLALAGPDHALAQGNLLITPRRVVFEGSKRTEEINIANTGKDTARYVISTTEMTMKEDGTFAILAEGDSAQSQASPYIRFFPHSVVLAPNEAQLVKVQIYRYAQLKPGEYRSHLYFRSRAADVPLGDTTPKNTKTISVSITPTFGISIPIIIRVGENNTKLALTEMSVNAKDGAPKVTMALSREGNMSIYGDIMIDHISEAGKVTRVGFVKGLAVYTSINKRYFSMPLNKDAGVNYNTGKLHISFTANESEKTKLAEGEISLN